MKKGIRLSMLFVLVALTSAMATQDPVWHENFDDAMAAAKESGNPILLNFSGSDWCIWCKRLNNEVLTHQVFKDYAKKNLVLAVADFPRGKGQTQALKDQNNALLQKYGVRGFPTVLLISSDGKLIAQTGYMRGGAKAYVAHLKELLAPKK